MGTPTILHLHHDLSICREANLWRIIDDGPCRGGLVFFGMVVSRLPPRAVNAGSSGAIHPHSPLMGPWSVMIFAFGHSAPTVCYRFRKLFSNTKPISAPLGTDFREGIEAR